MTTFSIQVKPALTLADTRISATAVGKKTVGPAMTVPQLDRVCREWQKVHRPNSTFYALAGYWVPTRLRVVNDRVAPKIQLTPVAIGHRIVDNSDSDIDQEASVEFSAEVGGETTVGWSEEVTAGVEFSVSVEVGSEFAKASASTAYSLSSTVGHSSSKSESFSVGTTEGSSVTVPAGQIALLVGLVQRGTLTFEVDVAWRPEDYAHITVITENQSGTRRGDLLHGPDLAPFCGSVFQSDVARISIPFASEAESKVIAPLADATPASVDAGLRQAINSLS